MQCLQQQTYADYQLVLVDDGCHDGTVEAVLAVMPQANVLKGDGQLWWAGSINKAIDWLTTEDIADDSIVLMINDDTSFDADFLQQACRYLNKNPHTLLLARQQDVVTGEIMESGMHLDVRNMNFYPANNGREINCLSTRGLFLFWSDLKKIGKLRDKWLPHYGSDTEFTFRAYRQGFRLATDSSVYLTHDKDNTNYKFNLPKRVPLNVFFSHRYDMNPVMLTRMAILVSPWDSVLPNIFRVWYRTLKNLLLRSTTS